jgi:hypothetical protein
MLGSLELSLKGEPIVKSRSEIWLSVLEDLGNASSVSTHEDALYVRSRVAAEGDTFFQVTLPQFAKDLEQALAAECVSPDLFVGYQRGLVRVNYLTTVDAFHWKSKKFRWGLPLFLSGFTRRLFMEPDELLEKGLIGPLSKQPSLPLAQPSSEDDADAMADSVFAVRQLCLLFSKEKADAPAKAQQRAIAQYIQVDKELDRPL